ncbi:MAG: hypothetical protein RLZZ603_538 [Actinomycetota bacterium]|nr:DUF3566 domain-containing protein [Actinomycetales bacterium]
MSNIVDKVRKSRPSSGKQVKLNLVHIEFWSAIKVGFTIQLALAIANLVGFFILWLVASKTGLFSSLGGVLNAVVGGSSSSVASSLSLPRVMSFAVALSAFNIVVGTLLAGVIALIFNLISRIVGGIGVGFTNNQ